MKKWAEMLPAVIYFAEELRAWRKRQTYRKSWQRAG
jgi:hypothetical protein